MQTLGISLVLPVLFMVNLNLSLVNANLNLQKRNALPADIRRETNIRQPNPIRSGRTGIVGNQKTSNGRIIFYEDNNEPLLPRPKFPPFPGKKSTDDSYNKPVRPPVPQTRPRQERTRPPAIVTSTARSRVINDKRSKTTPRVQKTQTSSITQRPQKSTPTLATVVSRQTTPRVETKDKSIKTVNIDIEMPPEIEKESIAQGGGGYYVPFRKLDTKLVNETTEARMI